MPESSKATETSKSTDMEAKVVKDILERTLAMQDATKQKGKSNETSPKTPYWVGNPIFAITPMLSKDLYDTPVDVPPTEDAIKVDYKRLCDSKEQ